MNKVIELNEFQADLIVEALNDKLASLNQLAARWSHHQEAVRGLAILKQRIEVVLDKL